MFCFVNEDSVCNKTEIALREGSWISTEPCEDTRRPTQRWGAYQGILAKNLNFDPIWRIRNNYVIPTTGEINPRKNPDPWETKVIGSFINGDGKKVNIILKGPNGNQQLTQPKVRNHFVSTWDGRA